MASTTQSNISIYTEQTPNPATMKFVLNRMLLSQGSADFPDEESAKHSQLATELFGFPYVRGVFIASNFVTLTKDAETEWIDVIPVLREFIKQYIGAGKEIVSPDYQPEQKGYDTGGIEGEDIEEKIVKALDKYIRPAVEMDGGAIKFRSFDDGVVTLTLQGSCSGCPSSTITLKAGIENLLKKFIPEVKEVVAENE